MPPVSPKAVAAFLVPVAAALALYALTGDEQWLIGVLGGFASGGAAVAAPPAPRVSQEDVAALSEKRRDRFGPPRT